MQTEEQHQSLLRTHSKALGGVPTPFLALPPKDPTQSSTEIIFEFSNFDSSKKAYSNTAPATINLPPFSSAQIIGTLHDPESYDASSNFYFIQVSLNPLSEFLRTHGHLLRHPLPTLPPPSSDATASACCCCCFTIKKKYHQFLELQEALSEEFSSTLKQHAQAAGLVFPPKHYLYGKFFSFTSSKVVRERISAFDSYLQFLVSSPLYSMSPLVLNFLTSDASSCVKYARSFEAADPAALSNPDFTKPYSSLATTTNINPRRTIDPSASKKKQT